MAAKGAQALSSAVQLLLSPLEDPFRRYLDVCDDVHLVDAKGNTLLHWAAAVGNASAAYALLQCGVQVDARNVYGATPLHLAAAFAPNVGVIGPLLMRYGASLNAILSPQNPAGVESLLASRGLSKLWSWMVELDGLLHEDDGRSTSLFRCGGSSSLPSVTSIKTRAPLLCAPEDLHLLMKTPSGGAPCTRAEANAKAVRIPRAPARDLSSQGGLTHLVVQRQPAVLSLSSAEAVEAVPSSIATSRAPPESTGREWEATLAVLVSREEAERTQLEKTRAEALLEMRISLCPFPWFPCLNNKGGDTEVDSETPHWSLSRSNNDVQGTIVDHCASAGLTGPIVAVFGEKYDSKGGRWLFVQYREGFHGAESGEAHLAEAWCPLASIAHDPVVLAYLDCYSRTCEVSNPVGVEIGSGASMLNTDGNAGCPLDSMERKQLEEQLRMLPRRSLSSRGSCSSLNTLPRPPSCSAWSAEESPNDCDQRQDDCTASPTNNVDLASTTSSLNCHAPTVEKPPSENFQSRQGGAWVEKKTDRRPSWGFAKRDQHSSSSLQEMWSGVTSSVVSQPTLSVSRARGVHDGATSTADSNTSESGAVQLNHMDGFALVHRDSLLAAKEDISTSTSGVDTEPLGNPDREDAHSFPVNDGRYYLSSTQREKYNMFLRSSALQRLQKLQKRLSSRAAGGASAAQWKATTRI
ncbi:hypothetical protein JKF63_02479 [Porcisia hertigi]|uniref:Uncharacterized protein n=1 Tax=Porcisia hertigi TaxID=2761500 RepID=A0A836LDL0_9TRYP|nr:hypothetical protein JKF63_02479 [Porcisia hertigi]